ncbi:MAG: translation initiation factor IF-2 [Clostridia bacterium]|nr:translation initiation factor IF-2 [Clostridia bacterium]
MAFNPQFKINQIAKDMGLKSKELTDLLADKGIGDVKSQKTLTEQEFNILFQTMTEANQVDNIYDYMDGKTCIPSKIAAAKAAEKAAREAEEARIAAEKAAAEKAAREAAEREAKERAVHEAAERAAAEAKAAREAAEKAAAETARLAAEAASRKDGDRKAFERAALEKAAAEAKAKAEAKRAAEAAAKENALKSEQPAKPAQNNKNTSAPAKESRPAGQDRPASQERPAQNTQQGQRPVAPQRAEGRPQGDRFGDRRPEGRPAQAPAMGQRSGQDRPMGQRPAGQDRFSQDRPPFGGQQRPDNRGANRPQGRNDRDNRGGTDRDKGDFVQSAPKEHFQVQAIVRGQTPKGGVEQSKPRGATRVVDTRVGDSVDLSKYDEKLDTFVSERVQESHGNQKLTKKNNQQQGGKPGQRPAFQKGGKNQPAKKQAPVKKQPLKVEIPDEIVVSDLASRLKVTVGEVVKRLMLMGMMVTVNQTVDFDTAALVADELGAEVEKEVVVTIEEKLFDTTEDTADQLKPRAPVVCVMGHVDHGKTSLLDAIRHTRVTAGEAGGITQHIGAYRVSINDQEITFLDTPGHEAFTAMRARGAQATDIAILVVAADDGIMPQTVEAINHAKAAGIDIIVAINKMDKPAADPENVKQELTKYELVPEEWGGDVICVPVSALTGMGIDDLLENVLLVAEVKELKANPDRRAKGIVIESKLDKGRGPVATVLVQNGTLHNGDIVIAGTSVGRVRVMSDHTGRTVKVAGPSVPVEITGLADVPDAGDEFEAVVDERMARELAEQRKAQAKEEVFKANARANLNDLFSQMSAGIKDLNVIVKADVDGTVEAVKASLQKLSNEEVRVRVIHAACGGITEGDVTFAAASNAIIVGFNVRPDKQAMDSADRQNVEIRTYRVIYECIEEIQAAMKGMLAPKFRENILGHAEVRQTIHVPNVGTIAGSYITDGKIVRSAQIRIVRDGIVIFEDKISSLRRFKDDVKEVADGYECGVGLDRFNDIKVGDILEAFVMEEIPR